MEGNTKTEGREKELIGSFDHNNYFEVWYIRSGMDIEFEVCRSPDDPLDKELAVVFMVGILCTKDDEKPDNEDGGDVGDDDESEDEKDDSEKGEGDSEEHEDSHHLLWMVASNPSCSARSSVLPRLLHSSSLVYYQAYLGELCRPSRSIHVVYYMTQASSTLCSCVVKSKVHASL